MGEREAVPVVVVGRGPVGMTLSLLLALHGVRSVVIDPHEGDVVDPGSKAVLIAQHVMDVTWPVGVGEQILAEGLAWTVSRTFIRGKEVRRADVTAKPGMLPRVVNLTQERVEQLLLARVRAEPLITVVPRGRVVGVEQDEDFATVVYVADGERCSVRARWVAGCDGARSTLRKLLEIPFEGYGHDDNFLIADVWTSARLPAERHFHFDPPYNRGRTVLIHPQPNSTVHIDWQVGPEVVDAQEELRSGGLDARLRAILGDERYSVKWVTTYRFKQLRARSFRKGRCFLVGDAAHLTSPYGARGMNSGIADAENLAWRLSMVVHQLAAETLLDSYERERIHASVENLAITGRTARFMCPMTVTDRLRQRVLLRVARAVPAARRFVDSGSFYQPARYPNDAQAGQPGVPVGAIVADVRLTEPLTGATRLGALLRRGIAVLWVRGTDANAGPVQQILERAPRQLGLSVIEVGSDVLTPVSDPRHHRVGDPAGSLAGMLCPDGIPAGGRVVVVRPDAHVASVLDLPLAEGAADRVWSAIRACFQLISPDG